MTQNPYQPPTADLEVVSVVPAPYLWNPNTAGVLSLFLSPVFGSYIIGKNWEALGHPDKQKNSAKWLWISVAMLIASALIQVLALPYIFVWYFAQNKPQAAYLQEKFSDKYPRKGMGKPVLIAFGIYVAAIAVVILAAGLISAVMGNG